jgi:cytochrome c nitrite reductase small subunit
MSSYYQGWDKSSHKNVTTCNDCHLPQNNILSKYAFKAVDGLYHTAMYVAKAEPQVIRPNKSTQGVIVENCVRCHSPLTTEFVKMDAKLDDMVEGRVKACWDCHAQVPHTKISNLASASEAVVPLPASPVPQWLKSKTK